MLSCVIFYLKSVTFLFLFSIDELSEMIVFQGNRSDTIKSDNTAMQHRDFPTTLTHLAQTAPTDSPGIPLPN